MKTTGIRLLDELLWLRQQNKELQPVLRAMLRYGKADCCGYPEEHTELAAAFVLRRTREWWLARDKEGKTRIKWEMPSRPSFLLTFRVW